MLVGGDGGDGLGFQIPNAKFLFTVSDTPAVAIQSATDATACLDCGTIWITSSWKVDPTVLRKKAARWMEDGAKKSLDLG